MGLITQPVNSPIFWFGGKGNAKNKIIPLLESIPHKHYVEPFGGGASVLLGKKPALIETYNDIDGALYDFFCVMSDPVLFKEFERRVAVMPYSRRLYNDCRATWQDTENRVERVAKWFVLARQSFGGKFSNSWGSVVTASSKQRADNVNSWLSNIERLPRVHARLQRVQIEDSPALEIIRRYDTPQTLFYLDPPYVLLTRKSGGYAHEMTMEDHMALVEAVLNIQGQAVLSGYPNKIYAPLEAAGWELVSWETSVHVTGNTSKTRGADKTRVECLWVSPGCQKNKPEQLALF